MSPSEPSRPSIRRATIAERAISALVMISASAPIAVASGLTPAPSGHGTHMQLGMPACGWLLAFGKPCISCGMTTAFSHAVRGDLVLAASCQPAGAGLAVLASVTVWLAGMTALTGSRIAPVAWSAVKPRHLWVGFGVLIASWIYTVLVWPP